MVTILISAAFRGAALIRREALTRGRRLFECGYPKVRRLLEGGVYLRPDTYLRKYSINLEKILNRPITKFYNGDDAYVIAAELLFIKTRPTSFCKKHYLL